MFSFNLTAGSFDEAAKALVGMGSCGSLKVSQKTWENLLQALAEGDETAVSLNGEELLREAVPEIGETDPKRGELLDWSGNTVSFGTPGGVNLTVGVVPEEGIVFISVGFGRNSRILSSEMLESIGKAIGA